MNNKGWHRSTKCASAACVEVYEGQYAVLVRDSKDPDPIIVFDLLDWQRFVEQVRTGF